MYLAGTTASPNFPTTVGAFDRTYNGSGDAFVSKLDPSGSFLVYSTFLGGSELEDVWSLEVGLDGSAYIGGLSYSEDFPTTPGSFSPTFNGGCCDGFVTKLDPDGAAVVYSTFLGGGVTESVRAIDLASDGSVYASGETHSEDFPTTPGAFATCMSGGVFVSAFNSAGSALVYSTCLGAGSIGHGIVLGNDGTAYVTGETNSTDFPTTAGAFDRTFNGGNDDMFVTRLNEAGSALLFSTYVGGGSEDEGFAIGVDPAGNVYLVGSTSSPTYPTTPGAYDLTINSNISPDAFATKLNPGGSALEYSTFLGGSEFDSAQDLSLDPDGSLNLTGATLSGDFPTTPGAFDPVLGGPGDAFVARFNPTGSDLVYGSFLGGSAGGEGATALTPADPGLVSVAGSTSSEDFPVTPGAYDTTFNGDSDVYASTLQLARTMHVGSIDARYRPSGPGYVVGARIWVGYADGSPVQRAKVRVEVSYPDGTTVEVTRQTGPHGIAVVVGRTLDSGTYTFTVLGLARPPAVYDPSQNTETSDSITIPTGFGKYFVTGPKVDSLSDIEAS